MALSLRTVAQSCLGLTPPFSVNSDVYGYIFRGTDGSLFGPLVASDILPGTNTPTERSLTRHLQTISGRATDLVPIFVGHVNDFSGAFSLDDALKVQYAIQVMRDIYAQQNFGVRRLNWQHIPQADVGGYADILNRAEAEDLTDDWSGPAGGIDVFFVQSIGDAGRLVQRRWALRQGLERRSHRRRPRSRRSPGGSPAFCSPMKSVTISVSSTSPRSPT